LVSPQIDKDQLLLLSIRLGRRFTNLLQQRMDAVDQHLIGPHMGILTDLGHTDGVRQQDLAVSSLKDKATITRALRSLAAEGLVRRTPDPHDKRSKRIFLTDKGREVLARAWEHGRQLLAEATQGVDADGLAQGLAVLNKMYHNLKQETEEK
jgi:DNA-binding MarR family transcriptional regulator